MLANSRPRFTQKRNVDRESEGHSWAPTQRRAFSHSLDPKQPFRVAAIALDLLTYNESRGLVISWGSGFVHVHMPQFCGVMKPHLCGLIVVGRHPRNRGYGAGDE